MWMLRSLVVEVYVYLNGGQAAASELKHQLVVLCSLLATSARRPWQHQVATRWCVILM